MLTTRGTRFTAAISLTTRDRFSVATLAFLSIFLIGLSVVLLAAPEVLGSPGGKYFDVLSIVASVGILVTTLFDYALGRGVLAHQLHQNAIRITPVIRDMERELKKPCPDMDKIRSLAEKYECYISETQVNHSWSDHQIYKYSRQQPGWWLEKIWFPVRYFSFRATIFFISVPFNILVLVIVVGGVAVWYVFR